MSTVAFNLYTNGNELITNEGRSYIGYYHINSSGSIFSESDFVSGVSQPLRLYTAMPENGMGDVVSEYDEENDDYDGIYTVIPVKNYKNDIDLPEETILLEDPGPITITDQPDLFFKRSTDDVENPGLEVFIDESNVIRVRKGATITLQFGYESSDSPDNIEFQWFDSFDRIVSTDPILVLDTNELDAEEDIFYCTVTDSFGSDTTNEITITIVDPADNPFMFNNILANGNANDGTANWDSVGDAPEDTGKFLPVYEQDEIPDIVFGLQAGSRFYHKFNAGPDGLANKNQWYPRPSDFDRLNKFNGTVVSEIKDNYFRAGNFLPVVRGKESNHSGTTKNSIQIVDLTDIGDLIDGKVFGLEGFDVTLFGWLGGRADQADRVFCEFEFLNDENEVILTTSNTRIEDADWYQRTINEYREPNQPPKISYLHAGYKEPTKVPSETPLLKYDGIYKDGNIGIDFNRYEIITEQTDGSIRVVTPVVKTVILGRTTDMVRVPVGTRSIRVIKTYYHVPGIVDLIWGGDAWAEAGNEYVSDALVAGLNLRMYPILKNTDTGNSIRTGLDNNGNSVIKFMNFLEEEAAKADIEDLNLVTDGTESGTQYYDNQELMFDPVTPVKILKESPAMPMFYYYSGNPNSYNKKIDISSLEALGAGWGAYLNDSMIDFIEKYWGDPPSDPNLSIDRKIAYAAPTGLGKVYTDAADLLPITGRSDKGVKMEDIVKWDSNNPNGVSVYGN